jgi:hypothetical protein
MSRSDQSSQVSFCVDAILHFREVCKYAFIASTFAFFCGSSVLAHAESEFAGLIRTKKPDRGSYQAPTVTAGDERDAAIESDEPQNEGVRLAESNSTSLAKVNSRNRSLSKDVPGKLVTKRNRPVEPFVNRRA